jgi:VWFA-related protein
MSKPAERSWRRIRRGIYQPARYERQRQVSKPSFSLLAVLLLALSSFAQQPDSQQQPEPSAPLTVVKARSDLVLVPVVVKDKKGKYIAGLAKDAFQLEENGKPQTLSLFEEVQPPAETATPAAAVDLGYSNLPFDNANQQRLTILVLDLLNTSLLQREDGGGDFVKFLAKGLPANQPVSLLCLTKDGLKLVHPFTTDSEALIQALKKMSLGPETIASRPNRIGSTIDQLREISEAYIGVPGRKSMVLAIGNIPELAIDTSVLDSSKYSDDLRQMWQGLINANISVYPVQLMNWTIQPGPGFRQANVDQLMNQFAEATGGNRCMEVNNLMGCLTEAVDDSRSYYMLGFRIQPEDRKPGWRDLKVKVSAEHIDVRARSGFYYGITPPDDPKSAHNAEIKALASPLAATGVPIYVKALPTQPAANASSMPDKTTSGKTTVAFLITIPFSSVRIDSVAASPLDLDVGAIALTSKNTEAAEVFHPVRGTPKPEHIQQWQRDGLKLQEKLDLPSGSYDVRFLVRDNNAGQIGTVVFPLEVK